MVWDLEVEGIDGLGLGDGLELIWEYVFRDVGYSFIGILTSYRLGWKDVNSTGLTLI